MGPFHPSFDGVWKPQRLAEGFETQLAARVRSGLLPAARARRNRYEVLSESDESVRFRSVALLTSANIGWNDVEIRADRGAGTVAYHVTYWAWTRYCVVLGLGLAALLALLVVVPVFTGWYPFDENLYPSTADLRGGLGLPMMGFWCLVFPWILVAMHKGPARRGFEALLADVNSEAS